MLFALMSFRSLSSLAGLSSLSFCSMCPLSRLSCGGSQEDRPPLRLEPSLTFFELDDVAFALDRVDRLESMLDVSSSESGASESSA